MSFRWCKSGKQNFAYSVSRNQWLITRGLDSDMLKREREIFGNKNILSRIGDERLDLVLWFTMFKDTKASTSIGFRAATKTKSLFGFSNMFNVLAPRPVLADTADDLSPASRNTWIDACSYIHAYYTAMVGSVWCIRSCMQDF